MSTWGSFPGGVKRPKRKTDHSPQFNAEVNNALLSYASTPPIRLHGVVLKEDMYKVLWNGT